MSKVYILIEHFDDNPSNVVMVSNTISSKMLETAANLCVQWTPAERKSNKLAHVWNWIAKQNLDLELGQTLDFSNHSGPEIQCHAISH